MPITSLYAPLYLLILWVVKLVVHNYGVPPRTPIVFLGDTNTFYILYVQYSGIIPTQQSKPTEHYWLTNMKTGDQPHYNNTIKYLQSYKANANLSYACNCIIQASKKKKHKLAVKCKTIVLKSKLTIQLGAHIHNVHCLSRTYQMINSATMSIIIPVTSPPRNVPTSVAAFEVGVMLDWVVSLVCRRGYTH